MSTRADTHPHSKCFWFFSWGGGIIRSFTVTCECTAERLQVSYCSFSSEGVSVVKQCLNNTSENYSLLFLLNQTVSRKGEKNKTRAPSGGQGSELHTVLCFSNTSIKMNEQSNKFHPQRKFTSWLVTGLQLYFSRYYNKTVLNVKQPGRLQQISSHFKS